VPTINQLFDLTGRAAIVTGGSRGLGREMAEGLAEAGASLMLCARREEWLTPTVGDLRARGFTVEGAICDVSNSDDVQAVVSQTKAAYGRIDILVNNAGLSWGEAPETMPREKWHKVIDANLTGAFLFSQAAGRVMLEQEKGCIINIASVAGLHGSVNGPQYVGYAASKAGLMGLTRELAASWGRRGIRHQSVQSDSAGRRRRRTERRGRVPGGRRLELHHRTSHRRRRRTVYRVKLQNADFRVQIDC